jgi:hypothetical protein
MTHKSSTFKKVLTIGIALIALTISVFAISCAGVERSPGSYYTPSTYR